MERKVKLVKRHKETPEEIVSKEGKALDELDSWLEGNGVVQFTNDSIDADYLLLPKYLDEAPSRELGRYLHTYTMQKQWVRTLLARVKYVLVEKWKALQIEKQRIYSTLPAKTAVKEKELALMDDEVARELVADYESTSERVNVLAEYLNALDEGIFDISREITRRGQDFNDENRLDNISKKRRS